MAKIILKAVLWGVASWLLLTLISFFGLGFYNGFMVQDSSAATSSSTLNILRYASILMALVIAVDVFMREKKKYERLNIVATKETKPISLKREEPMTIPPPFVPPKPIISVPTPPPPRPAPAPFIPQKPAEPAEPIKTFEIPKTPPPPISTPSSLPKSSDLKQGPDQVPWS